MDHKITFTLPLLVPSQTELTILLNGATNRKTQIRVFENN